MQAIRDDGFLILESVQCNFKKLLIAYACSKICSSLALNKDLESLMCPCGIVETVKLDRTPPFTKAEIMQGVASLDTPSASNR